MRKGSRIDRLKIPNYYLPLAIQPTHLPTIQFGMTFNSNEGGELNPFRKHSCTIKSELVSSPREQRKTEQTLQKILIYRKPSNPPTYSSVWPFTIQWSNRLIQLDNKLTRMSVLHWTPGLGSNTLCFIELAKQQNPSTWHSRWARSNKYLKDSNSIWTPV